MLHNGRFRPLRRFQNGSVITWALRASAPSEARMREREPKERSETEPKERAYRPKILKRESYVYESGRRLKPDPADPGSQSVQALKSLEALTLSPNCNLQPPNLRALGASQTLNFSTRLDY